MPNMTANSNGTNGQANGHATNGQGANGPTGTKTGDLFRDYADDRNATSEDVVYTTSNG